ncbi:40S ribosomal protein S4, Y isoform 2 [Saguinus oedipus]|uniref:40S ribosomal protein S4, Y isoform 2 n=1 Tax=Saguinus oedipus TaxID=9490 RepID=A0ABQ9UE22_SAGOE|nr:40S ribosomal protein S4, Y isoform 2 [Saguinus oedipus]
MAILFPCHLRCFLAPLSSWCQEASQVGRSPKALDAEYIDRCVCSPPIYQSPQAGSLPLIVFLRNRLKYALTGDEAKKICMQQLITIDDKVSTDITYAVGSLDDSINKTRENFLLICCLAVHSITLEEAKLFRVRKNVSTKEIPDLAAHDTGTTRCPDPYQGE